MKHAKKLKLAHKQEKKKQLKEMITIGAQMLDLADKGLQSNYFKYAQRLYRIKYDIMIPLNVGYQ